MKKLLLTLLFILIAQSEIFSQIEMSLQLVDGSGNFINTYTSSNIKFRRSPYGSGDVVSGLTVTHPSGNTTGNYLVYGFPSYEPVRLFINDVQQDWFGTQLAGDPRTFFGCVSCNNTWSGTNTFNNDVTVNDLLDVNSSSVTDKPYISDGSPWYSDYGFADFYPSALIWREFADSVYGPKWWYSSSGQIFSNYKIRRPSLSSPLFDASISDFSWNASLGLTLSSTVWHRDSVSNKFMTNKKDTCILSLGECNYRYRLFTLKKPHYYIPSGLKTPDYYWVYRSIDESGATTSIDSFAVVNEEYEQDSYNNSMPEFYPDATFRKVDSLVVNKGTYLVTFTVNYLFGEGTAADDLDSIEIGLKEDGMAPNTFLKRGIYAFHEYNNNTNSQTGGTLSWQTTYTVSIDNKKLFLFAKAYQLSTSLIHTIQRAQITAIKVR